MANPKRPRDPNQLAKLIVDIATGAEADAEPEPKNEAAVELEGMAFSEVLTSLRSLSANVADLTAQMKTMKWVLPAITGVGFAVVAIMVTVALALGNGN